MDSTHNHCTVAEGLTRKRGLAGCGQPENWSPAQETDEFGVEFHKDNRNNKQYDDGESRAAFESSVMTNHRNCARRIRASAKRDLERARSERLDLEDVARDLRKKSQAKKSSTRPELDRIAAEITRLERVARDAQKRYKSASEVHGAEAHGRKTGSQNPINEHGRLLSIARRSGRKLLAGVDLIGIEPNPGPYNHRDSRLSTTFLRQIHAAAMNKYAARGKLEGAELAAAEARDCAWALSLPLSQIGPELRKHRCKNALELLDVYCSTWPDPDAAVPAQDPVTVDHGHKKNSRPGRAIPGRSNQNPRIAPLTASIPARGVMRY